ncbi:hypothetical protein [Curtobacterium sp. 'Ferrero']|uniref:hypothetical protein n=1 Tax=Curtobacterium sp. 'Ferrero' TaxID=2033654 RepID=UPI001596537E|nr:hypothetical protein [Curtobacterium sp. 'Ferrero']
MSGAGTATRTDTGVAAPPADRTRALTAPWVVDDRSLEAAECWALLGSAGSVRVAGAAVTPASIVALDPAQGRIVLEGRGLRRPGGRVLLETGAQSPIGGWSVIAAGRATALGSRVGHAGAAGRRTDRRPTVWWLVEVDDVTGLAFRTDALRRDRAGATP